MPINYTSAEEYIRQLDFTYLKTYSFCRGEAFKDMQLTDYLTGPAGDLHPSAILHHTISKDHSLATAVMQALNTPITERAALLCAPHFRDGIIFYNDQHEVISVLNVCLSCCHMETAQGLGIKADFLTFDLLKKFFLQAGHEVEKPEQFWMPEIEKLRLQYHR
ncbi:hypothetical protein K1Y79_13335 [Chitinophaga sp. B61]|uniref:SUKH-3 immunity protein of toxin-antitoxin system n=2 Tax=Chitinophaga rhizophila TaxID=2866212 RepID=A0ABS7GCC6_9BACT|nr:hypothetical protein [Chitinophaga rhizophila]